MTTWRFLLGLVLVSLLSVSQTSVGQENWPSFRGPSGSGHALGAQLPTEMDAKTIDWETAIHGKGWSSPVVWGNQVWLTTATDDGKKMSLLCLDLDSGEIIRDLVIHENESPAFCHPTNSYASPTPVIEEGRIYVHFGQYGTTCVDTLTGNVIWQRTDLECDHYRGPASSPILFENRLIVAFDGVDQQYVVALDTASGKTVWKKERAIEYGTENGDFMKAYATGAVFDVDGEPLLIYPSAVATIAYDPRTGRQVWIVYHEGMNASSRPVMAHNGLVMLTNGMGKMVAVDPSGKGDITQTHIKWRLSKAVAKKSSLLVIDHRVYMVSDRGIVSCIDPEMGRIVWQERIRGAFAASPIYDGKHVFALSEQGEVHVFEPGTEFVSVGKTKMAEGFKASPAVAGNRMILRGFSKLYCVSDKTVVSE